MQDRSRRIEYMEIKLKSLIIAVQVKSSLPLNLPIRFKVMLTVDPLNLLLLRFYQLDQHNEPQNSFVTKELLSYL